MPPQELPKEKDFIRCPKAEATRMYLPCDSVQAARGVAEEYSDTAETEGLLIEVVGDKVVISAGSNSLAQATTELFFLFGRQNIVYEKEVDEEPNQTLEQLRKLELPTDAQIEQLFGSIPEGDPRIGEIRELIRAAREAVQMGQGHG